MATVPSPRSAAPGRDALAALCEMARERPLALPLRGGCMAPLLADGERVEVAPARRCWPGDVLVVRAADGRFLAHRLLGYRPFAGRLALVTRGDGCPWPDAPVPRERVIGRVTGRIPARGGAAEPLAVSAADRLRAAAAFLRLAARGLLRRLGRRAR